MIGKKAVVLLSGGLDSAVTLAIATREGFECFAISFQYGQRHERELESARRVAQSLDVQGWEILTIPTLGGSALTYGGDVPKDGPKTGIPSTYVPARNLVFLSLALSRAEALGSRDIFLGVNAVDYSGYPDCRPEFVQTFECLANFATKAGLEESKPFRIHSPLIDKSKAEIVRVGLDLGVDFSLTSSCYDPDPLDTPGEGACGECDSCRIRLAAFRDVGIEDPITYRSVTRG